MTVSTVDGRAKAVLAELLDKQSTEYPLSALYTDITPELGIVKGQSIDIVSAATPISFEDGTADADLTSQAQSGTASNLVVDQMPAANVDLPALQNEFDLGGNWASQLATKILTELNDQVDTECYKKQLADAGDASATYWVNPGGVTLTDAHIRLAMAKMMKQKGVRRSGLVWCFDPYGEGSLASISAFATNAAQNGLGALGIPTIGTLHGIPVVVSQSVPSSFTVACTAVSISSNVATVTVPSGHGIVPGHKVTIAGITTPLSTAAVVASAGATSFTVPLTASDGAMADGAGTVTVVVTCNGLIYRPWSYIAKSRVPRIETVKREKRVGHFLQAHALYGRKFITGSFIGLGSPSAALTGS